MLYKNRYRVESIRLKKWDYSSPGYYFVTICIDDRKCCLGTIDDNKMVFSKIGNCVNKYWEEIPNQFPFANLDGFVIMPNHVHGIVRILDQNVVYPDFRLPCRDAINRVSTWQSDSDEGGGITKNHNPMLNPFSLSKIIRWYKGRSTYEINKILSPCQFSWQPRFYESIIRTKRDLDNVRQYIVNNPSHWKNDEFNLRKNTPNSK